MKKRATYPNQRNATSAPPEPLKADPARQAGPLFEGISYQVWQTVMAWSELSEWKLTEHIIRWCAVDAGTPTEQEVVAPRPGICSEVKEKERHELLKDTPRGPALMSWYSLAEAELYAGLGRTAFLATVARQDVNDYPGIRPMIEFLRVRRALTDGEFENIPVLAESAASSFSGINVTEMDERTLLQRATPSSQRTHAPPPIRKVSLKKASSALCS